MLRVFPKSNLLKFDQLYRKICVLKYFLINLVNVYISRLGQTSTSLTKINLELQLIWNGVSKVYFSIDLVIKLKGV